MKFSFYDLTHSEDFYNSTGNKKICVYRYMMYIYICEWFIESWRRKTYGLFWAVTNLKTGFKKIQERDLGSRIYFIFFIWPVALSCYTQTAVENSILLIFTWKHTWDPYFRNSGVNRTKYLKHFILKEKRNNPQLVWFYKTQVNSLEVKGW